jgi:hypothetical protein
VQQKSRAMVAAPGIVGGVEEEFHLRHIYTSLHQMPCGKGFHGVVGYVYAHFLAQRQCFYKLAVGRENGMNFIGPAGFFVRPTEPCGFVGVPFGGEIKAQCAGCCSWHAWIFLGKLRVGDNADTVVAQNCSGSLFGDKFPFTLGGFPLTAQKIPLSKNLGWLHSHCCIFTVTTTNFISAPPVFHT